MVYDVLREPGAPLDANTRAFFEPRFGADFSNVRIHTGETADTSAGAVAARAYAVEGDIAFAENEYNPNTAEGRHLLAHELAHVVQQSEGTGGGSEAVAEREAETAADTVAGRAGAFRVAVSANPRLSRAPAGVGPDDLQHIRELARELVEVFPQSARKNITVAVAIVEDSDGFRTLVYAVNRNGTSKALRAKAAELGIERWNPMIDRKAIKGAQRAFWHAEQLIFEAASENDFRVLAVAPSNKACPDCAEAAHAEEADVADPKKGERSAAGSAERAEQKAAEATEKGASKGTEREIVKGAEKGGAGAIEHKAAQEVGEHAAEGTARVLKERLPRVIAKRLGRIAASKTAKRALSVLPLVGWAFSAKDAWAGAKDVMHGHVGRGLAGIGCAAADVASDFLHVGDAVSGVGGTALSLAIQAGTITCQVVLEIQRSKERMEELQKEVRDTGKLPPDEKLRDYYELDDEAIKELKEGEAEPPKPAPAPPPAAAPPAPAKPAFDPNLPMV